VPVHGDVVFAQSGENSGGELLEDYGGAAQEGGLGLPQYWRGFDEVYGFDCGGEGAEGEDGLLR